MTNERLAELRRMMETEDIRRGHIYELFEAIDILKAERDRLRAIVGKPFRGVCPEADDKAFDAGYAHVESMIPAADSNNQGMPMWYGWALRKSFWAGVNWVREATNFAKEKP